MGTKAERTARLAAAAMPAAGRSRTPARKRPPAPRARSAVRATPIRTTRVEAPFTRRAVFEELESRLLMSADLNPVAHETLLAAPALQGAEFRALADDGSAVTRTAVTAVQRTTEIVFVDPRVPDRERCSPTSLRSPTAAASRSSSSTRVVTASRRSPKHSAAASKSTRCTSSPTAATARCSSAARGSTRRRSPPTPTRSPDGATRSSRTRTFSTTAAISRRARAGERSCSGSRS